MKIVAMLNHLSAQNGETWAQCGGLNRRTIFLAWLLGCVLLASSSLLMAQPGQLDPTFGNGGKVSTFVGPTPDLAGAALALQRDGKIVVAGGAGRDFVLARYNPNGTLDPTFGTHGIVSDKFGYSSAAEAVAIQTDGKIVAAGTDPMNGGIILARFNPNGTLDSSFGNDGSLLAFPSFQAAGSTLRLLADGKMVVAGGEVIARFDPQGKIDSTFGTGGIAATVSGVTSLGFQSDGKILVAGSMVLAGGTVISRYNPNGTLDTTFGILGSAGSVPSANAIAIQNDQIYAAGAFTERVTLPNFIPDQDLAVVHYASDGIMVGTFGTRGAALADFLNEPSTANASAVAVQTDGKIVAAGQVSQGNNPPQFALARFTTTGALDLTFGNRGTVVTDVGGTGANALVLQPDGKIVAAGSFDGGNNSTLFVLARYLAE